MYYADPDGNQMEFQVDAFSGDDCNAFIRGEGMELNPVGVEFDPEEWLARLRAGAPEIDLLARKVHDPVSPIRGYLDTLQLWAAPGGDLSHTGPRSGA
jgi:hypothetical protein